MIPPKSKPDSHEQLYFSQLHDACEAGDASAAITSVTAWLGACCEESAIAPREFAVFYVDRFLAEELAVLDLAITANQEWTGAKLLLAAKRMRERLLDLG